LKNKQSLNSLSKRLIIRSFSRILLYSIAYTFIVVFGMLFMSMVASSLTWQYDDPLYIFLNRLKDYFFIIMFLILLLGYLYFVFLELSKAYRYLQVVTNAVDLINEDSHILIELPYNDLKEINETLNQIKFNVQLNARAAKEAEQRKNDLIVYLAHDLKTPLTSIIGYLTLLHDEEDISKKTQEKYLSIAQDKAYRLEDLINEFFEITRFNLTEQVLELRHVDLSRLIEQLSFEFNPMLKEKNLTCSLNIPKEFQIRCDIAKIQRVLDNLLRNAIFYSFENTDIQIQLIPGDNEYEIIFTNHGNTIPKEKCERLFEQFYRLDSSRQTNSGGAGLGLAISKEIVELHHGSIYVESENDLIQFTVKLPVL